MTTKDVLERSVTYRFLSVLVARLLQYASDSTVLAVRAEVVERIRAVRAVWHVSWIRRALLLRHIEETEPRYTIHLESSLIGYTAVNFWSLVRRRLVAIWYPSRLRATVQQVARWFADAPVRFTIAVLVVSVSADTLVRLATGGALTVLGVRFVALVAFATATVVGVDRWMTS